MNLHTSKSKNSESFYIAKYFAKSNGSTSSKIIRKLGTLEQLLVEHGPARDNVIAWATSDRYFTGVYISLYSLCIISSGLINSAVN